MRVRFHKIILSILFTIPILFLNGCDVAVVCLNNCFKQNRKAFFYPQKIPNAMVSQPYSVKFYIDAGYVDRSNIDWKITPDDKTFKITFINKKDYDILVLSGTPEKVGQYQINIAGKGFIRSYPPIPFNHTYTFNILNQSTVCNNNNIILVSKKDKENQKHFQEYLKLVEMPKATINQPYIHQIELTAPTEKNEDISKSDVQIITYPQDSGLQIRPVRGDAYNIVELYGSPRTIGNIEIIIKRYSILYKRYILPVVPDQSSCR